MNDTLDRGPDLRRIQRTALGVGVLGVIACVVGAFFSRAHFFQAWLFGYVFWLEIALGCFGLLMMHHLVGGGWGLVIRRMLESGTRTIPLMTLLFIPILFGLPDLYQWARPETVARSGDLQHVSRYLNEPFFVVRTVLYFTAWLGLSYGLNRLSREEDQGLDARKRLRQLSGGGLVLYGLTQTFAAVDWIMSTETNWYSTTFGLITGLGQMLSAMAFVIILAWRLAGSEPLRAVITPRHFQDLGNLLLAFVMLWAYVDFSQFLIIWSGNLPRETVWYAHRTEGGWLWLGLGLIVFHFAVPFSLLLFRRIKRTGGLMAFVAAWIIAARFLADLWMVLPGFQPLNLNWMDIVAPIGIGGIWLSTFLRQLARRPLLPVHVPVLEVANNG